MTRPLFLFLSILSIAFRASAADGGFLFVGFRGEQTPMSEQIYFAISHDGRHWDALMHLERVLVSELGEIGVRDPYLLRSQDG